MKSINWAYQQEPGPVDRRPQHLRAARQDASAARPRSTATSTTAASRQDFDTWAQLGNRGWGYSDNIALFQAAGSAGSARATTPIAAATGNLNVTTMDWQDPLCEAFMGRSDEPRHPRNHDYNGAIQEGVSYAQRTIRNGMRVSAATAFLHPARKRPNVEVRTHAHAHQHRLRGPKRAVRRALYQGRQGRHAGGSCAPTRS